ncbi:hypothetical protein CROQUDRAFT_109531 [Cronartium quercuum f. sp. fusiforme G11]|uniref:Uncharacterized protein n=1 Tax=Cronartium quercuum f. sp. fusiforme G11 TaxID=708437 RepID=A0A9P6NAF9_9BASI|nr:hypothetical protein CROQUDRAFT_109531 [Cronartium quercuum f. sp. fusiforme G11]
MRSLSRVCRMFRTFISTRYFFQLTSSNISRPSTTFTDLRSDIHLKLLQAVAKQTSTETLSTIPSPPAGILNLDLGLGSLVDLDFMNGLKTATPDLTHLSSTIRRDSNECYLQSACDRPTVTAQAIHQPIHPIILNSPSITTHPHLFYPFFALSRTFLNPGFPRSEFSSSKRTHRSEWRLETPSDPRSIDGFRPE